VSERSNLKRKRTLSRQEAAGWLSILAQALTAERRLKSIWPASESACNRLMRYAQKSSSNPAPTSRKSKLSWPGRRRPLPRRQSRPANRG
jgi:hypothetical protein